MDRYHLLRNTAFLIVFVVCMTGSCMKALDGQLDAFEQGLDSDPILTYKQLSELSSDHFRTESERARYALLMSMAMDKSYIDVEDDSLIQIAVRYYQRHGDANHRMLSLYSLGRVQFNAQKRTAAIVSFTQAKDIAEEIGNQHYMGLIMRNMAYIYGDSHDYDTERLCYQNSARAFQSIGERNYAAYSEFGEAQSYMAKGMIEAADSILYSLEAYTREINNDSFLSSILKNRAVLQVKPELFHPEKTIQLFHESTTKGFPLNKTVEFCALALAHEYLNQRDSAKLYYALAEEFTKSSLDSTHLYNTHYLILNHRGKYREAAEQLFKTVSLHNRMVFNKENMRIANSVSEFREQESIHQAALAKDRFLIIILLSVITSTLFFIMAQQVVIQKRKIKEKDKALKDKEERIEDAILTINDISSDLQATRKSCSELALAVNKALKDKISVVKMCADAYASFTQEPKENPKDPYRYLDEDLKKKKEETIRSFMMALKSFRDDESLFSLLESSVNRFQNGMMNCFREESSRLGSEHPVFSENDYRIIMLLMAGLPDRTIAFLMNMTCGAVRTRKTRLRSKITNHLAKGGEIYLQAMDRMAECM